MGDKSGNISDLGSRVIKTYHKPNPSARPPSRVAENSMDTENEDNKTARSIKIEMKRRRSKTGDEIKGLAFKTTHVGNYVEEAEENSKTEM